MSTGSTVRSSELQARVRRSGLVAAVVGVLAGAAFAADRQPTPSIPDTFVAKLEALALIETLNAEILASRSATASLQRWCGDHGMAAQPVVRARRDKRVEKPATAEQRRRLEVGPDEPLRYRHVQLVCGEHVLSEADNWYVPSRLTPEMNRLLDTSDTPFGRVVAPLKPTRQTVSATLVWSPLPAGWELRPPPPDHAEAAVTVPHIVFEHRAVLSDADHHPFSEVEERYTSEILAFDRQH